MNERPLVSHNHSDLILRITNWDTSAHEETEWNVETREHLGDCGQREKCSLCDITGTERQLAALSHLTEDSLACTSEKLPPSSTDLQGGLHPSRHGNSLHSPILACLHSSLSAEKDTEGGTVPGKKFKTKQSLQCHQTPQGFQPSAQSCLTEPAAIEEMFNSLHVFPNRGQEPHVALAS